MHIVIVPILGIILTIQCIEANLSLDFKVTKISASPANCNVANTTYAHGETFKLDCRTQCVCENGRHACSSLCPKEQLPAPEDTISCRSPRLVEVPGHCCKMWVCENPTADVYATCHNSSTSPWTPCSQPCGLGISTRFTATTAGCNQLINLRLCENRKCETTSDLDSNGPNAPNNNINNDELPQSSTKYATKGKDMLNTRHHKKYDGHLHQHQEHHNHRIKKGHECRHVERLGPARIRLGQCVSRKLYRPKVCGHCHHPAKCCMPSVSTTIQVELLCPLNADDPISLLQQQLHAEYPEKTHQQQEFYSTAALTSLWDTHSLDAIDQEYFQSHQIHIENKFIAIEWILKCECSENESCRRSVKAAPHRDNNNSSGSNHESYKRADDDVKDNSNNLNMRNNSKPNEKNIDDDDYNYFGLYGKMNKNNYRRQHLQRIDDSQTDDYDGVDGHTSITRTGHNKQTRRHNGRTINDAEETEEWPTSALSSPPPLSANSDEIQPDIIPYPPPPFTTNKQTNIANQNNVHSGSNNNNNNVQQHLDQTAEESANDKFRIERQQQQAQQQQYFYEQWLLQQQQQERQQSLFEQLLGT